MRSLEIHDARGPRDRTRGRKWCIAAAGPARGGAAGPPRGAARRGRTRNARRSGGHGGGRVTRYGPAAPPQPPVITKTTKHMNTTLITLNAQFGRRTNTLSRGPGDRRRNPPSSRRAERIACPPKLKAAKPNSLCLLPPPASSWPHRSCWSIASPSVSLNRGPDQASR